MDEIKKPEGDATLGQDSPKGKESNSPQTPRNYTEAEYKKGIEDAIAQYGDRIKREQINPITKERDTLKSQLEAVQSDLTDNAAEIEKLQEKFDAMALDDPNKFDVAKELKAGREERRQLKVQMQAIKDKELTYGERIKRAESFEREALIQELIEEYEGGDFDRLKDLCEIFAATSEEQIRKVADTLWTKKTEPVTLEAPPVKLYSGRTEGGTEDLSKLSGLQLLQRPSKKK